MLVACHVWQAVRVVLTESWVRIARTTDLCACKLAAVCHGMHASRACTAIARMAADSAGSWG